MKRLAVLVMIGLGAAAAWFWLDRGRDVTVVTARAGAAAEVVYATGVVEPHVWSKVSPLVRARVVEHCRCEGRNVRRGEVLARLDDTGPRAELAQVIARRDFLIAEVSRQVELVARGTVSRTALERSESELRAFDSQVAALAARLTDYAMPAPMDGMVLRADGNLGDIVSTGEVLFWVGQPRPLRVVSEVNEEDVPRVAPGQSVLLRNDGFPQGGLTATVGEITPKGDPVAKTFRVYLLLPETTPLRIGMSVEANILISEKPDALLVPVEALRDGAVFVVRDGLARRQPVRTGIRGTGYVEVVEGLSVGEQVIAPVPPGLGDGEAVRLRAAAGR
jgi:RND family efflux transporter MFP subunit